MYLFTTKGPSLKSHNRRNRLNAGPGDTGRRALMRVWNKNRGWVETVASTVVILLSVPFSQLKLHVKERRHKIPYFSEDKGRGGDTSLCVEMKVGTDRQGGPLVDRP